MTTANKRRADLALIDSLPEIEQLLLRLTALIYEPVSTDFIAACLTKAKLPGNRVLSEAALETYLDHLRSLELQNAHNLCQPAYVEPLVRQAVADGLLEKLGPVILRELPFSTLHGRRSVRCRRALRQYRIGVYTENFDLMNEAEQFLGENCGQSLGDRPPVIRVIADPFDRDWFATLPTYFQFLLLNQAVRHCIDDPRHCPELLDYLTGDLAFAADEQVPFRRLAAAYLLPRGDIAATQALLAQAPEAFAGSGYAGAIAFLRGDYDTAEQLFQDDLATLGQLTGQRTPALLGPPGLFHGLLKLRSGDASDRAEARRMAEYMLLQGKGGADVPAYAFFAFLCAHFGGPGGDVDEIIPLLDKAGAFNLLFGHVCLRWLGVHPGEEARKRLRALGERAVEHGFAWLAMELDAFFACLGETGGQGAGAPGLRSISALLEPDESWRRSLRELIKATTEPPEEQRRSRLAWMVRYENQSVTVSLREQRRGTDGLWSKGRPLSLARILQEDSLEAMSPRDRRIRAAIVLVEAGAGQPASVELDLDQALPAMIGHPCLYLEDSPGTQVEFSAGEAELLVEEHGDDLAIRFNQRIGAGNVLVHQETPIRFKIIRVNDNHRRVAAIIGPNGLRVPRSAGAQVLQAIGNISSFMTVHSAIGGHGGAITEVVADPTIHVHIMPYGGGFRIEMFVKPFTTGGHYLKPGEGAAHIMAEIDGRRVQTHRDLRLEEEKAQEIEESCPILDLATDMEQENDREWLVQDWEECLQALLELGQIRDQVVIEWPEGEKLAVRRQTGVNQLNLNIRTNQQGWFSINGQLVVNEDEILDLKEVLDLVIKTRGRFIPMGDGQYLALTQEFRRRLDELLLFAEHDREHDEFKIHPLAALALEELTSDANTEFDEGWRIRMEQLREINTFEPEVPSTLQADLRDYQVEGFNWMARLARLGVGCCLADDMGLGKTLQALTVILDQALHGPTLVVTPTSVCMNWALEAERFTPTMRVQALGIGDRELVIGGLGKFDVLVISYTLLQQEVDLLATVSWRTIVLDEAQAIKNAATKRSRAAMSLRAHFRVITTGTPIENHLGELWNLFRFINPGLLGSFKQFNKRFGIPIEKHYDREVKRRLKKLIRPFILRRIKSQVLDELPPRTEITLRVEMSPEERNFYEALRRQAIENIEAGAAKPGHHMQILAEIMKLRRACCHPRLVAPGSSIGSAKLGVFAEVIEELLGGHHKALVFSQFTGHLALIREHLDAQGIVYKYLDGTTPSKERQRQVDAFQSGEGDLFLISLKAGGLGLNLTAADYVIHMDPWWNPAVEDQASDRAHRIGQKRPVTIYRLVTEHTIEEKIVRMHQEKRDLAGSLLEGTDISASISADELLSLIREG